MKLSKLLLLSLLILPEFCHALTVTELKTGIRRAIRDDPSDTARRRFSDTYLLDLINESQKEINNALWLGHQTTYYTLRPNTTYYNLPINSLAISQVQFINTQGQTTLLKQVLQKSLYERSASWNLSRGTPVEYWVSETTSPITQGQTPLRITYIPIPINASTGTVVIWFLYRFNDLLSDSDVPFNNLTQYYSYHYAIIYKVAMHIHQTMGNQNDVTFYTQLYTSSLQLMKDRIGRNPDYTPGFSASTPGR